MNKTLNKTLIIAIACLLLATQTSGVWAATAQHSRSHHTATAPIAEVPDLYSPGARAVRTPAPFMPPNLHEAYPRADM